MRGKALPWIFVLALTGTAILAAACGTRAPTPHPTAPPKPGEPTPTATPTTTATPITTPTPTLAPTPTPPPSLRLESARAHQRNGHYEAAIAECEAILSGPATKEAAEARFLLGQNRLLNGEYQSAIEALQEFLRAHPWDQRRPQAHFLLARAHQSLGNWGQAIVHYRQYLARRDVVAGYVNELIGDCYVNLQDYLSAIAAYEKALREAPLASREFRLREKIAQAHLGLADYEGAIARYEAILARARKYGYRAEIEYLIGRAYQEWGKEEKAHQHFLEAVNRYPRAGYAYLALVELVEAGVEVDDFQRGLVDYYAGAYEPAIQAFKRYIEGVPRGRLGEARYYAGLSYREMGRHTLAIREFDRLVEAGGEMAGQAWLEKARTLAGMGRREEAVSTYREFARSHPRHELAEEALWRAAHLLEEGGHYDEAASTYLDLWQGYPQGKRAAAALFRAGLCRYRRAEYEGAAEAWRKLLGGKPELRSKALFWLGKALLRQGRAEEARARFEEAAAEQVNYYALRAADMIGSGERSEVAAFDEAAEREEAEAWLAAWLDLPDASLRSSAQAIEKDPRFQRGRELLSLGLRDEATAEIEALRKDVADDPLALYQLALSLRDLGLYRPSIACAVRLIHLSPAGSVREAPRFLQRLAYPLYFADLVVAEARAHGLDPLLLFALVRQESLFDGWATSRADARGLTQIIPSTGEWIARRLSWRGYRAHHLYRPYLNARFGAWYLARQLEDFGGDLFAALAAYNGGPGNAARWLARARGDDDLFVEVISLPETQLYVKKVYEHYALYHALYGR